MNNLSVFKKLGGHFFKAKGYSSLNPENVYKTAKQPASANWRNRGIKSDEYIAKWIAAGGWIGWCPPKGIIIVDIDDLKAGEFLLKFHSTLKIKTPNGYQMVFKGDDESVTNSAKNMTPIGIIVDYRTNMGQIIVPTSSTEKRSVISAAEVSEFPKKDLSPLMKCNLTESISPLVYGSMNDTLTRFAAVLARNGYDESRIRAALDNINVMNGSPVSGKEMDAMSKSAFAKFYDEGQPAVHVSTMPWLGINSKKKPFLKDSMLLVDHLMEEHGLIYTDKEEYCIYNEGVYDILDRQGVCNMVRNHLPDIGIKTTILDEVHRAFKWSIMKFDEFNRRKDIINFSNGTFSIKKGSMEKVDPSRDYKSTLKIPYVYNPKAFCPLWQDNLDLILPEVRSQEILQEIVGILLVPDSSVKNIMVLHGKGDTGKTLISQVILRLVGKENVSSVSIQELSENKFATSSLDGKLVNLIDDQGSGFIKDTGVVKALTGGSMIGAEIKRGKKYFFQNQARMVYICNTLPRSNDNTAAWAERHLIIPFNVVIPKDQQDKTIINRFNYEGILAWAIEGLSRLLANDYRFTRSDVVDSSIDKYSRENDLIKNFIAVCCKEGAEYSEDFQSLIAAYKMYADSRIYPRQFMDRLTDLEYKVVRSNVQGIMLDEQMDHLYSESQVKINWNTGGESDGYV